MSSVKLTHCPLQKQKLDQLSKCRLPDVFLEKLAAKPSPSKQEKISKHADSEKVDKDTTEDEGLGSGPEEDGK